MKIAGRKMTVATADAPLIVFLDAATLGPAVDMRRPSAPHRWTQHDFSQASDVAERLAGATVAMTNKIPITGADIEKLPDLKMIAVTATGYDVIDIEACRRRGIVVSTVQGYAKTAVPEHSMALILYLARGLGAYRDAVIEGEWESARQFCIHKSPIRDLYGLTLGIFGGGAIGGGLAKLAEGFGMKVVYAGRKGQPAPPPPYAAFEEVVETADVISLHTPLTPETRGMIGEAEFARMSRRPILINTSRGGLVDEEALVRAVEEGRVSGVGFDVASKEPPTAETPLRRIWGRPDVIVTPHVAWASGSAMQACWDQVIENIEAYFNGAPMRVVS